MQKKPADIIVLVTGDGGFDLLVNKIRTKHGKSVKAYSTPKFTAASLINEASDSINIDKELLLN